MPGDRCVQSGLQLLEHFAKVQGIPVIDYQHVMHSLVDLSPSSSQPFAPLSSTAKQSSSSSGVGSREARLPPHQWVARA